MRTNNLPTRAASVTNENLTRRSSRLEITRRPALALTAAALLALAASPVAASSRFRRGDADSDGSVSLSDALVIVKHLFSGGARPSCPDAADADDNGRIEITDAISTLGFLFLGSIAPPAPGPLECGADPTPDALGSCRSELCPLGPGDEIMEFDPSLLLLPENQVDDVASSLVAGQIRGALESILNSPGDKVTLRLEGGVNVAIIPGVPLSGEVKHEAMVTVRDDGAYEVGISLDTALGLGVELVDGIEASIAASRSAVVIFAFEDIDATVAAVQGILVGEILAPFAGTAAKILATFQKLSSDLAKAMLDLDAARVLEIAKKLEWDEAVSKVNWIKDQIEGLEAVIRTVQSKIDDFGRKLANALADVACKLFGLCKEADAIREAYEEWIGERDELLSTLKGYKDDLVPAEAAELAARIAKDVASAAVKQLENTVSALQSQVDSATSAANAWKLLLEVVDNRRRDLEANLRAIELHAASEGKIEAFLSPFPGVTLEGAGIGASVSGKHEIALRLELTSDVSIERIVLSVESKGEVKAKAALGVGLEGTAAVKLGAKVGFVPTNGWFELESRSAALGLDVSVVAVAGIGVTLQHGAGRELSVGLDLAQLDDVAPALWELVTEGDVENLATVLIGIDATFSAQDRWIGAAVAKAGGSYVGYGAKLGGAAVWEDRGQKVEETLSAGEVVTQLFQEEAVRDALELLGEAVTR